MRRIDRFRAMSAEELAEMLGYKACRWCSYYDEPNDKCSINIVTRNLSHCKVGITEGLNQDDNNTMPELEVGDIIYSYYPKIAKADFCVYLGNNIIWCCKDEVFATFVEGMKKFIKVIYRKEKHSFNKKEIWRADSD